MSLYVLPATHARGSHENVNIEKDLLSAIVFDIRDYSHFCTFVYLSLSYMYTCKFIIFQLRIHVYNPDNDESNDDHVMM